MALRDLLLMLFVAVTWSGGWIAGKVGVTAPVGTLALAALLLREQVAPLQLVAGALALLGVRVAAVPAGEGAWLRRFTGV